MLVHLLLKIIPVSLEVMHHLVNAITPSTSARNIHVMIEFLLIILTDVLTDDIRHDKLFVLLARVRALSKEVFILVRNLEENSRSEENMKETSGESLNLLKDIDVLKEDFKNIFLKAPADSSELCFPMSDGPLFMTLLHRNLNDLLNSNAYSVVLIKEEICRVKEHLEHIRSFFRNVEQVLYRDRWTRVLDVAYEVEHAINSILARDRSLLHLICLLPDIVEKIKLVKKRKLTSGPSEEDVISIVGMPGLGKTTLAYRVYNDKVSEDDIDDDVVDKLRIQLFGKRYLIVLDDLWDTATWDELTRPLYAIPSEFQNGSRVILTSRKKEVALHGKSHSDPLDLRLLKPEESWAFLEKSVFGEESYPDELRDVGEKISQKCSGLPLVLDLIGGVMSRKEKKEVLWLEILNNLSSFIFKDEEEVMKVIQLSYDQLSDHLKPSFLYLASYPKDEAIEISQLKDLWSHEGLVEQTDLKSVEEVTEFYVDELIASSLLIVRGRRKQRCQIHDLVHDFCSIKARTEKLFDLTSSIVLSSSSSSALMLHSRTLIIDEDPHSDDEYLHSGDTSSLFNPEKRNPFVKHLLFLQLECTYLPPIYHLRYLRLLKRLELLGMILRDTFLIEIGMLVQLRCLRILIQAEALPLSFSNLCNLETLVVDNFGPDLLLCPTIWSLAKLQRVEINRTCSVFNLDIDKPTKLENLTTLERLKLSCSVDSENIFKRDTHVHQFDFHFPWNLKDVILEGFNLTSDALSGIGRSLPNLQKLELVGASIQGGKEWNMEQSTFHNLKSLKLFNVSFSEWQVTADESFPVLEELEIRFCIELIEIPQIFGDIASLKSISLDRSPQLKELALNITKYVEEINGEDKLKVKYQSWT
ncbi:hypothetical protein BC332_34378 [Capsicum chinense]|nr:hypothetical protein BC332_34378 [Capsicum chinense]